MISTRRLALTMIALILALGAVGVEPASAAPPRSGATQVRLTNQALTRINKLASSSELTINRIASSRISLLEKLKTRGADNATIMSVADASSASITAIRVRLQNQLILYVDSVIVRVEGAERLLPVVTSGVVTGLQQQSVADDLIALVQTARDIAIARVTDAEIAALTAIDAEVAELTADPMMP